MKVLDVYSKKDLDRLTVKGKVVSKIMDDFFKNYPESYRENYDKNLNSVEIFRVDEHYNGNSGGEYSDYCNVLLFRRFYSIVHELMHMASCDYTTRISSYERCKNGCLFETALIEGMTEYFACLALNQPCEAYHFETFTAPMISDIDGVVESYFIPNYEKFIKCFVNKKNIISLMYALESYYRKCEIFENDVTGIDKNLINGLESSITGTIDSLIDIQVSRRLGFRENKLYAERFMDLIGEENLNAYLSDIWEDYYDYANEQVNKRILRRK